MIVSRIEVSKHGWKNSFSKSPSAGHWTWTGWLYKHESNVVDRNVSGALTPSHPPHSRRHEQ